MVLATQNPREHAGTFPLPESQLDRFLLRIRIGYPSEADERTILRGAGTSVAETLETVLDAADVVELQEAAEQVRADDSVVDYVLSIVTATRRSRLLALGVSPRGSLALLRAARAHALADGRDYLVPDDVKRLAVPALAHRVLLSGPGLRRSRSGRRRRSSARSSRTSRFPADRGARAPVRSSMIRLARTLASWWWRRTKAIRPTRDGWWCVFAAVGLGVAAVNTGNNLAYLLCSMLLALIIVSGMLSDLTIRGLHVTVTLPDAIHATQPALVTIVLANRKRRLASYSPRARGAGPPAPRAERPLRSLAASPDPRRPASRHRAQGPPGSRDSPAAGLRRANSRRERARRRVGDHAARSRTAAAAETPGRHGVSVRALRQDGPPLLFDEEVLVYPAVHPVGAREIREAASGEAAMRRRGGGTTSTTCARTGRATSRT